MDYPKLRLCGCKGCRTCLVCEEELGIEKANLLDVFKTLESYVYCPKCTKLFKGWDVDEVLSDHDNHRSEEGIPFPGVLVKEDFLDENEAANLMKGIDEMPWDASQSGRRKQNFGPKTNFKKMKLALGAFEGFPGFTKFVQAKFENEPLLQDFRTVEQCSLEYDSSKGASIDPHIDDCWVWGERVVTVKNSIDAMATIVHIEFNESFDIRVIDNGCGFDEHILQDIGERRLLRSEPLQKNPYRYGKSGKFLFKAAKMTAEMYIESIKEHSDVRLYKSIIVNTSNYKIYKADRKYKEASVKTSQGSMVLLNNLNLVIGDTAELKVKIVNSIIELALINYEVNFVVKDTATQQTLYESFRSKSLFDKFENFLESNKFFSSIHSISCRKHDVKVEVFICENGTSGKAFQYVYFNKLREHNGKWSKFFNNLCRKKFEDDLNSKCPVYLMNICAENYEHNQLAFNVIIDKCITKCFEELSQPSTEANAEIKDISRRSNANERARTFNEASHNIGNDSQRQGVRLGDYIFNNSYENYALKNPSKDLYRRKVCENWVVSLNKPKPKDNDSLMSVPIEKPNTQQVGYSFKKPKRITKPKENKQKLQSMPKVSTQIYKPSQNLNAFNNSSLIRASKKLIKKSSVRDKRHNSSKHQVDTQLETKLPGNSKKSKTSTCVAKDVPIELLYNVDPSVPDIKLTDLNDSEMMGSFKPLGHSVANDNSSNKFLDFSLNRRITASNSIVNLSTSFAVHARNDPFTGFLETSPKEFFPPTGSSFYSETSALHFRRNNNESVHTHYRRQTFCNVSDNNSLHKNPREPHLAGTRENIPIAHSEKSSSVVPFGSRGSSLDTLNDNVRQTGWPVTININFGQSK
ncbi:Alpha-ketoglutarate-dependent dioxygenase alkB like 4 [Pseudolycoriella hygida]|uniref:Alpha-ketoglutarate-dependent dioxygenase alkB like 4 n=1 Tax=Pseudolycoriella hygida TaxID=35572 RepID=A0A9Q0NHP4_9DIPT|nr:Alpha-ketoglutarate-dependent dioxygenase alkB like 4 [Pseudolycoriella hygida]